MTHEPDRHSSEDGLEEIKQYADWARRNLGEEEWARGARRVLFANRCIDLSAAGTALGIFAALLAGLYLAGHWILRRLPDRTLWQIFQLPALVLGLTAVTLIIGLAMQRAIDRRWRARLGSGRDAERVLSAAYSVIIEGAYKRHVAREEAAADRDARRETEVQTRSWLATELDGAHLVWWIAFAVLIFDWLLGGVLPEPVSLAVWGVAFLGLVLKVAMLPILMVCHRIWPDARSSNPRVYYRTLGDGWRYMAIALAPILLMLVMYLKSIESGEANVGFRLLW